MMFGYHLAKILRPTLAVTTDILIVGAGIAGAGLAWALSGQGHHITLIDMEANAGHHATGRSAAMFEPRYGPPIIQELTKASAEFFAEHFASPRGSLMLCDPSDQSLMQEALSLGFVAISKTQAHALMPLLRDGPIGFLYDSETQDLDVHGLHQFYLSSHRYSGGQIALNTQFINAKPLAQGWKVTTNHGEIHAGLIVNAAGAWADVIAARSGVQPIGLQPKRRSIALARMPDLNPAWPQIFPAVEDFYCKPQSGLMLISPADADDAEPGETWADELRIAEGIAAFEKRIEFTVTRLETTWAGLRSFAPDGDPVVGFDEQAPGFFWLAGQGGYGIQTSPALSQLAANWIVTSPPEHRLQPQRLRLAKPISRHDLA